MLLHLQYGDYNYRKQKKDSLLIAKKNVYNIHVQAKPSVRTGDSALLRIFGFFTQSYVMKLMFYMMFLYEKINKN